MPDSVSVQTPHRGKLFSVEVLSWTAAGGQVIRREVVRHPGAVLVVPRLDRDRLVLVRNFRVAVDEHLWELPAGTLKAGEEPDHAAGRELEDQGVGLIHCHRSLFHAGCEVDGFQRRQNVGGRIRPF